MAFSGKILLVDDEPHIRKYVGLILKRICRPTLLEAANGLAALALCRQEVPDLLLLDINMPHMDGLTLLRELRQAGIQAPVVMLTSQATRGSVELAAQLGALDYIRKDTPRDQLGSQLLAVLQGLSTPITIATSAPPTPVPLARRASLLPGHRTQTDHLAAVWPPVPIPPPVTASPIKQDITNEPTHYANHAFPSCGWA